MKLIVKNFGAIKESEIDLSKRHYFFVGYNNTGKTYLAKLIYDIFSTETIQNFTKSLGTDELVLEGNKTHLLLTEVFISTLLDKFASYLQKTSIPKSLKINEDSSFILKNLEIRFEFDIEKDVKIPPLESRAMIGINTDDDTNTETNDVKIYSLKKEANSLEVQIQDIPKEEIYSKLPEGFFENIPKKQFDKRINSIKEDISKSLNQSLLRLLLQTNEQPFFLPANRIFILENADELVEQDNNRNAELAKSFLELLQSNDVNQVKLGDLISRKSESNHTAQISYLISEIAKLRKEKDESFIQDGTRFYDDLIEKLSVIMGGKIVMDRPHALSSNWVEKFKIEGHSFPNERPVNMYLASSSINQLGILFLYFKYWAKSEKNFLMIDEPEENLHPESQIQLINLLLQFASTNNRILITTHSPLLAEMINNYLVLGQLNDKTDIIAKEEFIDVDLNPNNTGIYYFNGEAVTEHPIGSYGTIFSSFKKAQDKIYSMGEHLNELMFKQLYK